MVHISCSENFSTFRWKFQWWWSVVQADKVSQAKELPWESFMWGIPLLLFFSLPLSPFFAAPYMKGYFLLNFFVVCSFSVDPYKYNMLPPLPAQRNLTPPPTLYPQQPVSVTENYSRPRFSFTGSQEISSITRSKRADINVWCSMVSRFATTQSPLLGGEILCWPYYSLLHFCLPYSFYL